MKTILITGCSRGIGYETCRIFFENGWKVFGTSTTQEGVNKLNQEFPNGTFFKCLFPKDTLNIPENLDVLVNNAAIKGSYKETIEVNVEIPHELINQTNQDCKIINIVSEIGDYGLIDKIPYPLRRNLISIIRKFSRKGNQLRNYCNSKYLLLGLSQKLRKEGRDINIIFPGLVNTDLGGRRGGMNPIEIANGIYFIANTHKDISIDLFIDMHKR